MLLMDDLREIDCSVLKRLLSREHGKPSGGGGSSVGVGGTCLLLDCRPFLAHSAGFIQGSVNVRCNTIVRRRAKGSVSLEQMLPAGSKNEEEVLTRLRSGLYSAIIVYDERSPRTECLREDSTVSLVVQALRKDTDTTDICLLKGITVQAAITCHPSIHQSKAPYANKKLCSPLDGRKVISGHLIRELACQQAKSSLHF